MFAQLRSKISNPFTNVATTATFLLIYDSMLSLESTDQWFIGSSSPVGERERTLPNPYLCNR